MFRDHPSFDNHERVLFVNDEASGLRAIIAVHSTRTGPAVGGIRMWDYAKDDDALTDVLRLSRGMTFKTVMAGLPLGGGKSVIIGDAGTAKTAALLHAFGHALNDLGGAYIGGEDVGMTVADIEEIATVSRHVAGLESGANASGDPSPFTAQGVFLGILTAAEFQLGTRDLTGLRVGVQGLGNVGMKLCRKLHRAGARLTVTDIDPARMAEAEERFGAETRGGDAMMSLELDIFAPCAMGGVLSPESIENLNAPIVAGAANNQLLGAGCGQLLADRGILYAPDYVINAGGVINVAAEALGRYNLEEVKARVRAIPRTLNEIFERARRYKMATSDVADTMAMERLHPAEESA